MTPQEFWRVADTIRKSIDDLEELVVRDPPGLNNLDIRVLRLTLSYLRHPSDRKIRNANDE